MTAETPTTELKRRVTPLPDRFWPRVIKSDGCWEFTGHKRRGGYGYIWDGKASRAAHRIAYELVVGPIPNGLQLDHLCRNPGCVRPDHLEPVTNRENTLRAYAANRGHRDEVRVGQIWADTDPRHVGRFVEVLAIDATHATVRNPAIPNRRTRIRLNRFYPHCTGFQLIDGGSQ